METRIFEGKTSTEAIEKGLKELKVNRKDVEIKILEQEKRSFFSILAPRVVKVEITVKDKTKEDRINSSIKDKNEEKKIEIIDDDSFKKAILNVENFLEKWTSKLKIEDLKYEVIDKNPFIEVNMDGKDVNHIIGHRGEVLNEIQNVLSSIAGKNIEKRVRVILDISNYKEKRKKILEDLAEKIAKTVIKNKKSITLEPMNAYERKIIHSKLQNHPRVKTTSVGEEPHRKVVISLK